MRDDILFPVTLGLTDGIITVLMLASADFLGPSNMTVTLAVRIAFGSAFVGTLSFFIAEYSRLRSELTKVSQHLTMRPSNRLIKTDLGTRILIESLGGTLLSGSFGFIGALIPLLFDVILPAEGYLAIISAYLVLAIMGMGIASVSSGNRLRWIMSLIILGATVTVVGKFIAIVK
ncbi:MAG: hypothetical protein QW597_07265 [Thermoplasmataceae archaeon]